MKSLQELRTKLRQCLRLHDSILDRQTKDSLAAHAAELEAEISKTARSQAPGSEPVADIGNSHQSTEEER